MSYREIPCPVCHGRNKLGDIPVWCDACGGSGLTAIYEPEEKKIPAWFWLFMLACVLTLCAVVFWRNP